MTDNTQANDLTADSSTQDESPSASSGRPTTLNILLDNGLKGPVIPSFRTPSLEELHPLLRCEVEKILQQWKSPQTPGSFLNPKAVTEEQEQFANAFAKKLNELQESGGLTSLTASSTGSNMFNISLPELNTQNLPDFAEFCRQAVQQQQSGLVNPPILIYSPVGLVPNASTGVQIKSCASAISQQLQLPGLDGQKTSVDLANLPQGSTPGSVSITVPPAPLSVPTKETATLQLANGLKFEIKAGSVSPASVLKMLGLAAQSTTDVNVTAGSETVQPQLDPLLWPLSLQPSANNDAPTVSTSQSSPIPESLNRPSSAVNSPDPTESGMPLRPSSSISSNSSISQPNSKDLSGSNHPDTRLDPAEQYRMRLERKRARNRDAARKCRERKIRLIKSLEKDVYFLSEENKVLRSRLSRSKVEVERLKLFVVNHLEKECPAISNKIV